MTRDRDAYAAYIERRDANRKYLGQSELEFYLQINPSSIIRPLYEHTPAGTDDRAISRTYASRIEAELNPIVADANLTVRAEPYGGPKVGGPVPDQQYGVLLVGLVGAAMTTIVLIVEFADVIHRVLAKARELTDDEVAISNGDAVILAAEAIFDATGLRDLTFAFITSMSRYLVDLDEMQSPFDGWLVGFRSPERLYLVHVDWFGHVTLAGTDVSVAWTTPD